MVKYTIEVEGIYNLEILSSIAEMLDMDADPDETSLYLVKSLPMFVDELIGHVDLSGSPADDPESWRKIADRLEAVARKIREKADASGEA